MCPVSAGPKSKANSPVLRHAAPALQSCCGDSAGTATARPARSQGWGWRWWCWGLGPASSAPPPGLGPAVLGDLKAPCGCHFRRGALDTVFLQINSVKALVASQAVISWYPRYYQQWVTWGYTRSPASRAPPSSARHGGISPAPGVRAPGSNSTNPPCQAWVSESCSYPGASSQSSDEQEAMG